MIFETVPSVYAQSLFDLTSANYENVADELESLSGMIEKDPLLDKFFSSPLIKPESKVKILEKSLRGKAANELVNLLCVMAQRNRLGELSNTYSVYRYLVDQKLGLRSVHITTAIELDKSIQSLVEKTLENYYKSKLKIYYKVDSTIIGGILIKSEGKEIDTTLIKTLSRIRLQMLKKKIFGEKYYEN